MEGYSGGYGYGDGETMCRGHWEAYNAAVKREIEADEEAGDRVHGAKYLSENLLLSSNSVDLHAD